MIKILHAAIDQGITFFDPAEIQGPYATYRGALDEKGTMATLHLKGEEYQGARYLLIVSLPAQSSLFGCGGRQDIVVI